VSEAVASTSVETDPTAEEGAESVVSAVPPFSARRRTLRVLASFLRFFASFVLEEAIWKFPFVAWIFGGKTARKNPVRLRRMLEDLGGAFIKFGQLFSMRSDILPPAYCLELSTLFDDVPPFSTRIAKEIVTRELGRPFDEVFSEFGDSPVGAASFGQVHRVRLRGGDDDGRVAVVKICRPGSEETIDADSKLLILLGHLVDAMSVLGRIKLVPVFRDFVRWTRREVNYLQEGKNADHLHELTQWNPRQRIPYVYWNFSTKHVLTMEYLEGLSVTDIIRRFEAKDETLDEQLAEIMCDRLTIARNIWQTFLLSSFVGHVFHGDPHPGNIIVLPENTVGFVDFGLLGRLSEEARREQALMLDAVSRENVERLFVATLDVLDAPRGLLVTDTYEDFAETADGWLDACDNPGAPMSEKTLNRLINASMQIARQVGLVLPPNTMLFFKGLLTVDSVVLRMCPEFDYKRESRRALRLVRMRELDRLMAPGHLIDAALMSQLLISSLPEFLAHRVQDFEQGQRLIYRKLNLIPMALAYVARLAGWLGIVLIVSHVAWRFGWLDWLLAMDQLAPVRGVFAFVAANVLVLIGATLVFLWAARALSARAFVKVQRTG
jgi:ubiquinone biosynthesis protein